MFKKCRLNSLNFTLSAVSLLMVAMLYERAVPDNAVTLLMNEHPGICILGGLLFIPGYILGCIWLDPCE